MVKLRVFFIAMSFLVFSGCAKTVQNSNKLLQPNSNKLLQPHIKEVDGVIFEVNSCTLLDTRVITCKLTLTSKHTNREVDLLPGGYALVQDDAGNSYPVDSFGFGRNVDGARRTSLLVADFPYDAILEVKNVSTQATKVRAINVKRVDIHGQSVTSPNFVLTNPPTTTELLVKDPDNTSQAVKTNLLQNADLSSSGHSRIQKASGVTFEIKSCTLSKVRTITCKLTITSEYRDREVDLLPGGYALVQDDAGNSYPVDSFGFGRNVDGAGRTSLLVADTPYDAILEVKNVSTQATKVRAINVKRVDIHGQSSVASPKLVFVSPLMTQ